MMFQCAICQSVFHGSLREANTYSIRLRLDKIQIVTHNLNLKTENFEEKNVMLAQAYFALSLDALSLLNQTRNTWMIAPPGLHL